MAENQERHYNINKLNLLFAVASLVLLIALVLMFADDYLRPWKKYQAEFRELDVATTEAKYTSEENTLKANEAYQGLLKKIEAAKAAVSRKASEIKGLESELVNLKAKDDLAVQNYQFAKAGYDTIKYNYEEGSAHRSAAAAGLKPKYEAASQKLNALRLAWEQTKTAVDAQQSRVQSYNDDIKKLERERASIAKQAIIFEKKLRKIDAKEMSPANRLANVIRNLPIFEFLNPTYKVEQVVIKDITDDVNFMRVPKVDRCTTCHLGITNPDFKDAPQPFRAHPNLELYLSQNSPHPVEEFGCTSCHAGRGRGVSFNSAAHMPASEEQEKEWKKKYNWEHFHYWEAPMYPRQYTEAGCYKCHYNETTIKGAEKLNLGLNLMEKAGCYGCHVIEKFKDRPKVGPDLSHLSSKASEDWAYRWIRDPKSFRHNTWMPSFFNQSNTGDPESVKRTNQEIHAIVHYLFTHSPEFKLEDIPVQGDPKKGEELVSSIGCLGCHMLSPDSTPEKTTRQGLLREHGPILTGLKMKTSEKWLYNWLKDPSRYNPATRMPSLRLNDQETADITSYLIANNNPEFAGDIPPVDEEVLAGIVRGFLEKQTTVAAAQKQTDAMPLEEKLNFTGQKLIKQYGCYGCHIIPGFESAKPIGTDLTEEGSKSAEKLDFGFIDIPDTNYAWFTQKLKDPRIFDHGRIRPADERLRMPNFHFTDEEVEALVTTLMGFVKEVTVPSRIKPRTAENIHVEQGQVLVRELNCKGCHIIEGEGGAIQPTIRDWLMKDKGLGQNEADAMVTSISPPNLVGEGEKIQTEWLFEFIHSPSVIRPWLKARMPSFHLTDAQINIFVKYFSYLDKQDFPFVSSTQPQLSKEDQEAAEKLFSDNYFGCAKCHIVGDKMPSGSSDSWAPNFVLAKHRLKPEWIIKWLKNPQALLPGTKMPTFFDPSYFDSSGPDDVLGGDENKQIKILRDFIMTLTNQPTVVPTTQTPAADASGPVGQPAVPPTQEPQSQ